MGSGKCVYDAGPRHQPPQRTKRCSKWCKDRMPPADHARCSCRKTQKMPLRHVGRSRENRYAACSAAFVDGNPFMIGEFVAHDSSPQLGV